MITNIAAVTNLTCSPLHLAMHDSYREKTFGPFTQPNVKTKAGEGARPNLAPKLWDRYGANNKLPVGAV